jgi:hypothetical protein
VAGLPSNENQAAAPDFSKIPWRKIYCEPPLQLKPSWDMLSWRARGLYRLLFTACDRDGVIELGRLGLMGVCGVIGARRREWPRVERLLEELVALDWLVYDDAGHRLALAWYRESQEARSLEAQRKQIYRARRAEAQDSPRPVPARMRTVPADPPREPDCPVEKKTEPRADRPTDAQR